MPTRKAAEKRSAPPAIHDLPPKRRGSSTTTLGAARHKRDNEAEAMPAIKIEAGSPAQFLAPPPASSQV